MCLTNRGLSFAASLVVAVPLLLAAASGLARAQSSQDEKAIRDAGSAYREALARGDGKALAALWTADGDIVDDQGTVMKGRDTAALTPATDAPRPEPRVHDSRLRFLTPDVALEDGMIDVVVPGGPTPHVGRFSATWVRQGGAWKLAGLREARHSSATDAAQLADLDWMVGEWSVVNDAPADAKAAPRPTIEVSVGWNAGHTFLFRDMTITPAAGSAEPATPIHVTQRIGWDPRARQIHSWVFSEDGGHGEALWSRDGTAWIARSSAVLPDGSQMSSINVYTYDGKDRCAWQSFHTHPGGEQLPPVTMTMIRTRGAVRKAVPETSSRMSADRRAPEIRTIDPQRQSPQRQQEVPPAASGPGRGNTPAQFSIGNF